MTLITKSSAGYELIDSGGEEKLERFGGVLLARPDPQALWEKKLVTSQWGVANGKFEREGKDGKWVGRSDLPKSWEIEFGGLKFLIKPTSFKHTGLFPEQLYNWQWGSELIKNAGREVSVLNIFGYTGGATLAAAQAGASVTHVDASKTAVAWARENAKLSGLEDKPVRWITEDAITFLKREIKRGTKYDAIIMDPPAFGHGPGGELWKFEENFLELLKLCAELLSEKPLFVLINGYAAGYSPLAFAYNLESFVKKFGGSIEYGDLAIAESNSDRVLPAGIFARWKV
ncbi:MAG TPA: class I SAM-dependent methyltransferase [Candidatus Paceibacterota bacterium]|nr:class I SAM-dependent methyltransferase [Candidatus Paceibacterota bacterium]